MVNNNYKKIADKLLGYTKTVFEKIFEDVILPVYMAQCSTPISKPNYKIVKRESDKEYIDENPMETLKELGLV